MKKYKISDINKRKVIYDFIVRRFGEKGERLPAGAIHGFGQLEKTLANK